MSGDEAAARAIMDAAKCTRCGGIIGTVELPGTLVLRDHEHLFPCSCRPSSPVVSAGRVLQRLEEESR